MDDRRREIGSRRFRADWGLLVLVVMVVVTLLAGLWQNQQSGSAPPPSAPSSPAPSGRPPSSTIPVSAPSQPSADGYEYLLTKERWVVDQSPRHREVQLRHRESWRASDGWAWARQTGDDPARYIFSPDTEGAPLQQSRPDETALRRTLQRVLAGVPAAEFDQAQFSFVVDLLGVETLPVGTLSRDHRQALVSVLASSDDVTVTAHARDPLGRDATRVSLSDGDLTESLYVDETFRYLAHTSSDEATGQGGYRVVIERRQVDTIPGSLLAALGSDRVEKGLPG